MASRVKKPAGISQEDWESVDVPEATDAEFASARPFKEVFPDLYREWKKLGRPPVATPKVHISFRLAADLVDAIRAKGRGYNARVEKVLRDALAKGEL
ncbi:MAG: BrnA antitoxin family protein [Thiohalocapsa sp.]